jgi:hypothetical protein
MSHPLTDDPELFAHRVRSNRWPSEIQAQESDNQKTDANPAENPS